ncbi:MAG: presqualene diphosphate synthase HpnD [Burkholderiaceae bacterium]|nr:presqualene diphosphate synthase HpnD [Burkholderiaceae bacterium]
MTPDQYCESKVAESGSNLVAAFKILGPQPRASITALYAFCREVDDVVDECAEPGLAAIKLAWWREEIDRLFQGQPQHPVGKALLPRIGQHQLPKEHFLEIIAGCDMDLTQNRYARWEDLDLYCDRVAGAVGRLSARIFGKVNAATLDYALLLGRALQYTNIIRDVGDDARRGRIYIPVQALEQFNVDAASILRFEYSSAFETMMREMAARAHQLYDQALALLPREQRTAQRPGLIMAAIYRELLRLVEAESFQVLHQRISVAPARKLWLAWKASLGMMPA